PKHTHTDTHNFNLSVQFPSHSHTHWQSTLSKPSTSSPLPTGAGLPLAAVSTHADTHTHTHTHPHPLPDLLVSCLNMSMMFSTSRLRCRPYTPWRSSTTSWRHDGQRNRPPDRDDRYGFEACNQSQKTINTACPNHTTPSHSMPDL